MSELKGIGKLSTVKATMEPTVSVIDKFQSISDSLDIQSNLLVTQQKKLEAITQEVSKFKQELKEYPSK